MKYKTLIIDNSLPHLKQFIFNMAMNYLFLIILFNIIFGLIFCQNSNDILSNSLKSQSKSLNININNNNNK